MNKKDQKQILRNTLLDGVPKQPQIYSLKHTARKKRPFSAATTLFSDKKPHPSSAATTAEKDSDLIPRPSFIRNLMTINKLPLPGNPNTKKVIDYKVPKYMLESHWKIQEKRRNLEYATFKKKRPKSTINKRAIRSSYTKDIEKHSLGVPAPWKYEKKLSWIKGSRAKSSKPRSFSTLKQRALLKKWKGGESYQGNSNQSEGITKQKPVDKSVCERNFRL